jgi:hypothetical protein
MLGAFCVCGEVVKIENHYSRDANRSTKEVLLGSTRDLDRLESDAYPRV